MKPEDCKPERCKECAASGVVSCVHFLNEDGTYALQRKFKSGVVEIESTEQPDKDEEARRRAT